MLIYSIWPAHKVPMMKCTRNCCVHGGWGGALLMPKDSGILMLESLKYAIRNRLVPHPGVVEKKAAT